MARASARVVCSLITLAFLGSHVGYGASRGPGFPMGDVGTVMAKRGMVAEGFLLRAWRPKAAVAPGEQVQLWLTLQNVSDKALFFQRTVPEADFPLVVQDAAGRTVLPKTDDIASSCLGIEVQPGECLVRDYWLDRWYTLPAVGRYSITATARVSRLDGGGWTDVVADTVTFAVREATAQPAVAEQDLGAILFREERLDRLPLVQCGRCLVGLAVQR